MLTLRGAMKSRGGRMNDVFEEELDMRVLALDDLKPGKTVWLESYGYAFKTLQLTRAVVLAVTSTSIFFAFPFRRMDCSSYNADLTWRCWDTRPGLDALAEEEWLDIAA